MKLQEISTTSNVQVVNALIESYSLDSQLNESKEVLHENLSNIIDKAKEFIQRRRISNIKASIMTLDDSKVFYITSDYNNMVKEMTFDGNELIEDNDLTMNEVESRVQELREQGYRPVRRETNFRNTFRIIFRVLFGYLNVFQAWIYAIMAVVAIAVGVFAAIPPLGILGGAYLAGSAISAGIAWFTFRVTEDYEREPDDVAGQF